MSEAFCMIKGIILDEGGVREPDTDQYAMPALARYLGADAALIEKAADELFPLVNVGKMSPRDFYREIAHKLGKDAVDPDLMVRMRVDAANDSCLFRGMERIVRELRASGCKVAVLSNVQVHVAAACRENGRYEGLDGVFLSCETGLVKPKPEAYNFAVAALGLSSSECVFVDDKKEHVDGAVAAGLHGILFTDDTQFLEELAKLGVRVHPPTRRHKVKGLS